MQLQQDPEHQFEGINPARDMDGVLPRRGCAPGNCSGVLASANRNAPVEAATVLILIGEAER